MGPVHTNLLVTEVQNNNLLRVSARIQMIGVKLMMTNLKASFVFSFSDGVCMYLE